MIHFSVDDFILNFADLTAQKDRYPSIFNQPVFSFFQRMHEEYGAVFSLYCFGKDLKSGFLLEDVTRDYRKEFEENASWLKFGFHAMDSEAVYGDNRGTRTINRDADQALDDYQYVMHQLSEIVGEKAIDTVPRIHFFAGTSACCMAWKNAYHGVTGLIAADDNRISYDHSDKQHECLVRENVIYDEEKELYFWRTNIRLENEKEEEILRQKIRSFQGKCQIVFTHECYLNEVEMQKKIELCAREAKKVGNPSEFPMNCI
ncbi:MAG: hypothetical protein E7256_14690 [Lachnospiraceae bacterium]|nr:hypothetical protein [Lachnospiraceae bacterium]